MDKLEERIEESKKLPQEIKDSIDEICFLNNAIATLLMFFFAVINYTYYHLDVENFMSVCKYMGLGMAVVSVCAFEFAYRKDSFPLSLYGIETLSCAIITSYIPYLYIYAEDYYRGIIMTTPIIFAAYYVLKTTVSYVIRYRKYRKETITDIKEILDDSEEFKSYIDDDKSSKLLKEIEKQRKILEKENKKKQAKLKKEETPKGKKRKITRNNKK